MLRTTLLVAVFATGCVGELSFDPGDEGRTFGRTFDLHHAATLWERIAEHETWPTLGDREGFPPTSERHGAIASVHTNAIASADPDALPVGSILVMRSLATAESTAPSSITVMQRVANFDPDHNDWFWAEFESDGTVAFDEAGAPLAGAIDGDGGCIGCHADAGADLTFGNGVEVAYGRPRDLELAGTLWAAIAGHESWSAFEGAEGIQSASGPHGSHQSLHVNDVAAADEATLPPGSIIVKRNLAAADRTALTAITVMQRIDGFDPEHRDWFWAKFAPNGALAEDDAGTPLAGAIRRGDQGCLPCHGGAPGEDFVFVNARGNGP